MLQRCLALPEAGLSGSRRGAIPAPSETADIPTAALDSTGSTLFPVGSREDPVALGSALFRLDLEQFVPERKPID